MIDWDEFVDDQSGRKFYYNTLTKEKSWKPPRKTRGSIGEGKFYAFIKEFFKYLIKQSRKLPIILLNLALSKISGGNSANASPNMHEDTCDGLENETEKSRVIKRFSFEEDNSNHSKNNTFSQNQAIENEDIVSVSYKCI